MFKNSTLLITGGTGSFGTSVLKKFLKTNVKKIKIFSRDEKKQDDMRITFNNKKLEFIIGDIRDINSIRDACIDVDYIFHAAALKQVPSCEFYPMEAVKTNIIGTENVINASIEKKVKKIVILSTDKAVYPINAMGISKAMAEKVAIAKSITIKNNGPIISLTRYGNVMGSRGSVIPLFIDQIKSGKNITVTDLKMTRFLMSLDESVGLVLHAFNYGKQGDIFVQKSPATSIENLILALKDIFIKNNKIRTIGTRHGEKLFETLISREEMMRSQEMKLFYRIAADNRDLNYNKYFSEGQTKISKINDYTSHNTKQLNRVEVRDILLKLDFLKGSHNA